MGFLARELKPATIQRLFWGGVALTLGVFLLKFTITGFGVFGDGLGYYTPLRSLLFDGNLRVDNEYQYYAQAAVNFGGASRVPGPIPEFSKYTLGLGVVLLPFFLLGHLLALLLAQLGVPVEVNGMTWPYELLYCLGSLSLGICALVLAYQVACRYVSPTASAIAVGGIWFASPLTYYLCVEVSMSHGISAFLIALFLWITVTQPWLTQRKWVIFLGMILGLAAWVRPQDILFFSVPGLIGWLGIETPGEPTRPFTFPWQRLKQPQFLTAIAMVLGVALLMQIPQILIYLWQYQGLSKIPYLEEGQARGYGGSFHWGQPALWQVLFSGHRGLFTWHPITFLSILGLIFAWRSLPRLSTSFLTAFALQVYFIAAWWCWWQGASVGGRMFSNCTLIFVWGLAYFWQQFYQWFANRQGHQWAVIITLGLVIWNVLLVMQYQSAMIPPEDPVTLTQLYQNQFKVIPFFIEHLLDKF
jgi:hypothetical protein